MPRHARLRVAGRPWHVRQRGVNRCACFVGDADRQVYLNLLKVYARKHGCAVHAYVLMSNHVHLLLTPDRDDGVSRLMKSLGERYVPFFNRTHGRTGTLWEGRFRSSIVQSESYLFTCQCYIELNPVRAAIVESPGDYKWSSYAANAAGTATDLISPHSLYLALGNDRVERADAYRSLFGAPSDEVTKFIRESTNGGFAISDRAFAAALQKQTKIPVARGKRGRPRVDRCENENGAELFRPAGKSGLSLFK